jgi:hypothetical protein
MTDATKAALEALAIFAARHPRPPHVNQKQAAAMLGKSPLTVAKMVKRGTFKLNHCGEIPIEQVDAALLPVSA